MVKARCLIEMIGATNWWLDKNGRAHMVFQSHAEFAQQVTGVKFLKYGPDDNRGWSLQGQAYEAMYRKGWIRVSYKSTENRIQIEFRGSISRPAMEWLQDQAFERKAAVVDDNGRVYADFRDEENQGGTAYRYRPESIVNRLLETEDPKDYALDTEARDYERTVVWIEQTGDEVPVGVDANGFFFHDAAYGLAGEVPTGTYDMITSAIIDGLNAGEETGVVDGFRWVLRPHSIYSRD